MNRQQNRHLFRIADFNICITFNDSKRHCKEDNSKRNSDEETSGIVPDEDNSKKDSAEETSERKSLKEESESNSMSLLPSFRAFAMTEEATDVHTQTPLLFTLTVDDSLSPIRQCELIRTIDTGNGDITVYLLPDGGYQYRITDTRHRDCCLLQTDAAFRQCRCALNGNYNMRTFGLNNALMLIFAFAGSHHDTLLMHASCICHGGHAYPFTAHSGTGKSTHTGLWLKHIEQTELLNDDNPIIRIIGGRIFVYGSPWSGKTPCYRNIRMPLGALTKIERAPANSIERLSPIKAMAALLPACSSMKWDKTTYNNLCNTITKIVETTPIYTLHCLPDEEAARLCHRTITSHAE